MHNASRRFASKFDDQSVAVAWIDRTWTVVIGDFREDALLFRLYGWTFSHPLTRLYFARVLEDPFSLLLIALLPESRLHPISDTETAMMVIIIIIIKKRWCLCARARPECASLHAEIISGYGNENRNLLRSYVKLSKQNFIAKITFLSVINLVRKDKHNWCYKSCTVPLCKDYIDSWLESKKIQSHKSTYFSIQTQFRGRELLLFAIFAVTMRASLDISGGRSNSPRFLHRNSLFHREFKIRRRKTSVCSMANEGGFSPSLSPLFPLFLFYSQFRFTHLLTFSNSNLIHWSISREK